MKTATLLVNRACNARCSFCTARRDRDTPEPLSSMQARIAALAEAGIEELVITGGEPLLRPDIGRIVADAAEADMRTILETNGLLLQYASQRKALVSAGVHEVRVGLAAVGDAADEIADLPGFSAFQQVAVQRCLEDGVPVRLTLTIDRDNVHDAHLAQPWLKTTFPALDRLQLRVAWQRPEGIAVQHGVEPRDLVQGAMAVIDGCRDAGWSVSVHAASQLSPCLVARRWQYPSLLRRLRGEEKDRARWDRCDGCAVADVCGGLSGWETAMAQRLPARSLTANERRLAIAAGGDRDAAVHGQLVSSGFFPRGDGAAGVERVVRVNFRCNQDCAFCFVDRTLPDPSAARVRAAIDKASEDGVDLLSLSGGEPTLDPLLAQHVRDASDRGLLVQLQTNAVYLDDPTRAQALADAGLSEAFVSFHAASAGTSDRITGRLGTFTRTIAGARNLLNAGVKVRLNCVIGPENIGEIAQIPQLIADELPGAELVLSFATASTDLVPNDTATILRVQDAAEALLTTVAECARLGVAWRGLEGECGVPLCLPPQSLVDPARIPVRDSIEPPPGFSKPTECDGCRWTSRCPGVRDSYLAVHGLDGIGAVTLGV